MGRPLYIAAFLERDGITVVVTRNEDLHIYRAVRSASLRRIARLARRQALRDKAEIRPWLGRGLGWVMTATEADSR